ncbi:hypothetical protein Nepgr_004344 [Nepenthes gracilis]|uniref:Cyclin-dependent kinase inhibitor domain-containing protein n=1 Tax=Nepenthes gracilis TaxID=150966 RepID=A0AAD3XF42_NEPGR|nr:hypothetical protein Nepgr_004344 [Nepenthes gracilis]
MGKYMKKGKIMADVAVMEVSQPINLGVRTRAKTLALALQPNPELSYLQLRSRRLEKPQFQTPLPSSKQKQERQTPPPKQSSGNKQTNPQKTSSRLQVNSVNSGSVASASFRRPGNEEECFGNFSSEAKRLVQGKEGETEEFLEASFGENNLECDETGRSTRENTPCSFIRELTTIGTPGSAVRPSCTSAAATERAQRVIPRTYEMVEFFAEVELQQQKLFREKYNFDIVNDSPLPGRYEWIRVDP